MARAEARATYEALQTVRGASRPVVPRCTIDVCESSRDKGESPHAKGVLTSCMGFTYTGDFSRGQMEGQGRMEWVDGHTIEGCFREGMPNGVCTMTWSSGDVYTGNVVNGVRDGGGGMAAQQGNATYDGSWARGERCGWGRQCYADGSVYEGTWQGDRPHGRGAFVYASGDCYDGQWVNGLREGHGAMGWKQHGPEYVELYDGEWRNGVPHGQGISLYVARRTCEERYTSERSSGTGTARRDAVLPSEFAPPADAILNSYRGSFEGGLRHGWGAFYYADGSSYEGQWVKGKKSGRGAFTTAIGAKYHGTFVNDTPTDMPSLMSIHRGTGNEVSDIVPTIDVTDLRTIGDGTVEATAAKLTSLLLRFNTVLKELFHSYAKRTDKVAMAYTAVDWWRHRVPGHISFSQTLRLLSDAGLLDGLVTTTTVIQCAIEAVHMGVENGASPMPESLRIAGADAFLRCDGWLNYAQFVELLVRLAPRVCLGAAVGSGLCDRFNELVEGWLRVPLGTAPLCSLTRGCGAALQPALAVLEERYESLLMLEHSDNTAPTERFLCTRHLLCFLGPFLTKHGLTLHEAVQVMCPFQRSKTTAKLPPGFNLPGGDRQLLLAHELYTTGCGAEGGKDDSLLVSGVLVERDLSLVEFTEAIVALSIRVTGFSDGETICDFILSEIVPLPV